MTTGPEKLDQSWYRTMIDGAPDPMFVHDLAGRLVEVNRRGREASGYSRDELLQMSVTDVIDVTREAGTQPPARATLASGERFTLTGMLLHRDGVRQPVEVRNAVIELSNDRHIVATVRDLPRHPEQWLGDNEAQGAADHERSQLLVDISHEIRTPLNAIVGMTELLLEGTLTPRQRLQLKTIASSSGVVLELIEEILDYSTAAVHESAPLVSEFAVADLVETAARVLAVRAAGKGLELNCYVDFSVPQSVCADAGRLRQILINLIGNAVKFTDEGEVSVRVSANTHVDGQVELEFAVSDSGFGVHPDDQSSIFQPYVRGRASKHGADGTGLGLAICSRLVTAMGGVIGVRSSPGKGSTFWFRVPIEVTSGPRLVQLSSEITGARTLVAVAAEQARTITCEYLKGWGLRPETAHSIDEVKDRIEHANRQGEGYDLCLVDTALMEAGCAATLESLVCTTSAGKPTFIFMCRMLQSARECANCRAPMTLTMVKPIGPLSLERALRQVSETDTAALGMPSRETFPDNGIPHVLIAEDNPTSQATMLEMLTHLGYRSTAVRTGPAVLEALREARYDLLLLDCELPGMDGYDVAVKIREAETGDDRLPIVAVTAGATIQQRNRCLAAGMDEYLTKPLRLQTLRKLLTLRLQARCLAGDSLDRSGWSSSLHVDVVDRMHLSDKVLGQRLGTLFVEDAERRLERLRDAVAEHVADVVTREAHALKAGCLQVGAGTMANICDDLDRSARHAGMANAETLYDALALEFERIRVAMDADQTQDSSPSIH